MLLLPSWMCVCVCVCVCGFYFSVWGCVERFFTFLYLCFLAVLPKCTTFAIVNLCYNYSGNFQKLYVTFQPCPSKESHFLLFTCGVCFWWWRPEYLQYPIGFFYSFSNVKGPLHTAVACSATSANQDCSSKAELVWGIEEAYPTQASFNVSYMLSFTGTVLVCSGSWTGRMSV